MKILGFTLFFLCLSHSFSFSQPLPGNPRMGVGRQLLRAPEAIIVNVPQPLIVIGTLETNYNSLIMDHDNLKILETYTDSTHLAHFGEKGQAGVIVAELKTKTPLLRLDEVLDYFKVPTSNRHLRVLIDKKPINPELFLADIKQIQKIEIIEATQQDILLSPFYKNHWVLGEKYLNIIAKD